MGKLISRLPCRHFCSTSANGWAELLFAMTSSYIIISINRDDPLPTAEYDDSCSELKEVGGC